MRVEKLGQSFISLISRLIQPHLTNVLAVISSETRGQKVGSHLEMFI